VQIIPDRFLGYDDITFSGHAEKRMRQRDITYDEIVEVFERCGAGVKGRRKNTLEARAVTSHNRGLTVVYTRRPNGPHVMTIIDHSAKRGKGG